MTEIQQLADGIGRRRPSAGTIVRHGIDAAAAPVSFLIANALVGARWGAVVALVVALLVGAVRRLRGEPLAVVGISTGLVALYSASALAVGTGRAFFLPEVVLNVVGLVVCAVGLLVRRPVTAAVHRRIRGADAVRSERMRRFHDRLTLAWVGLFVLHVIPLVAFYVADSVVGLTVVSSVVDKPTILLMAVASVVLTRRAAAADTTRKDPV